MFISINRKTTRDRSLTKEEANKLAAYGWTVKQIEWNEPAVRALLQCEWMAGITSDDTKKKASITGIQALFLDLDDPTKHGDGLLEHVHEALKRHDISHVIATSENHMRQKRKASGEILPICPRLKIIVPLSFVVDFTDDQTERTWSASRGRIIEFFRLLFDVETLDASSLDANRYSYRVNPRASNFELRFHDGQAFDIEPLAVEPPALPEPKQYTETDADKRKMISAALHIFKQDRPRDLWLKACFAVVECLGVDALRTMTKATSAEFSSFTARHTGAKCGAGTLIHIAKELGWHYVAPEPKNDLAGLLDKLDQLDRAKKLTPEQKATLDRIRGKTA